MVGGNNHSLWHYDISLSAETEKLQETSQRLENKCLGEHFLGLKGPGIKNEGNTTGNHYTREHELIKIRSVNHQAIAGRPIHSRGNPMEGNI